MSLDYGAPNPRVFRFPVDAKRHWALVLARYRRMQAKMLADLDTEPEALQFVVRAILDALQSTDEDLGCFLVHYDGNLEFRMDKIELDADIADALAARFSADEIEAARDWILDAVRGSPLTFAAWAIGRLKPHDAQFAGVRVVFDHVVYDFRKQVITGIAMDSTDARSRVIRCV